MHLASDYILTRTPGDVSPADLSGRRVSKDKLDMAADVVAMANTSGGYILLGVDEDRSGTAV